MNLHALHGGRHLFVIGDIRAQAHRATAAVLNFQLAQVHFWFAAGQQADTRALCGESDRETLSDAASRARYQD
jgi:hypothetical protein